jgi:hypothetical protein
MPPMNILGSWPRPTSWPICSSVNRRIYWEGGYIKSDLAASLNGEIKVHLSSLVGFGA